MLLVVALGRGDAMVQDTIQSHQGGWGIYDYPFDIQVYYAVITTSPSVHAIVKGVCALPAPGVPGVLGGRPGVLLALPGRLAATATQETHMLSDNS